MSDEAEVSIELRGRRLEVQPTEARVSRGGEVVWTCELPFVVFVEEAGEHGRPTDGSVFAGSRGRGEARAKIRSNAKQNHRYKYDVAVYDEASGEMYGVDPTLIVVP